MKSQFAERLSAPEPSQELERLTDREAEVLRLNKLGLRYRTQAVVFAYENGVVRPGSTVRTDRVFRAGRVSCARGPERRTLKSGATPTDAHPRGGMERSQRERQLVLYRSRFEVQPLRGV